MKTMEDDWMKGILLEDPIVEDRVPVEPPSEFDPIAALAAVLAPPLITVVATSVIGEFAFFVWVASVLVGACYTVRRLSTTYAICVTGVYGMLMLFEFICLAMSVPGLVVLHGE